MICLGSSSLNTEHLNSNSKLQRPIKKSLFSVKLFSSQFAIVFSFLLLLSPLLLFLGDLINLPELLERERIRIRTVGKRIKVFGWQTSHGTLLGLDNLGLFTTKHISDILFVRKGYEGARLLLLALVLSASIAIHFLVNVNERHRDRVVANYWTMNVIFLGLDFLSLQFQLLVCILKINSDLRKLLNHAAEMVNRWSKGSMRRGGSLKKLFEKNVFGKTLREISP